MSPTSTRQSNSTPTLFGTDPAKRQPGYANFAISDPPLKLVLMETPDARGHGVEGALNHLGVEVETPEEVAVASGRLSNEGLATEVQDQTTCCFAVQDKVWVEDPNGVPWEVYTVLADAPADGIAGDGSCCVPASRERCGARFGSIVLLLNRAPPWRCLLAELSGERLPGGSGHRIRHRRPAALTRQCRAPTVRERRRHRGWSVRHHPHVRPGIRWSLQPGGLVRGRRLRRSELADRQCLPAGPGDRVASVGR